MMILTVSNLYPRPDQPTRGLFNLQLFRALGNEIALNLCPVAELRPWRWAAIRRWTPPAAAPFPTRYVPFLHVPSLGRNSSWLRLARALGAVSRELPAVRAVYATWLYPDGVAAMELAELLGVPAWIMVQGSDTFHLQHPVRRRAILTAARRAAGFVCVSRNLAERLTGAGVSAAKVHVVPNGVDGGRFRFRAREEARRSVGVSGCRSTGVGSLGTTVRGGQWVLFVGNLVPVKGPDLLLEAWGRVARGKGQGGRAEGGKSLVFVGDGPMRRALERRAAELGIAESVVFAGSRPHDEVAAWMNAADGLCLSSRNEGMPNAVLEALASGLPAVATDVGACRELLDGEPCARVVPSGDPAALAAALDEVLAIQPDRAAMAARHAGRFTWERQAESVLKLMGLAQETGNLKLEPGR
jgi:glycosyltransferase involved in cell wall biosynthesis